MTSVLNPTGVEQIARFIGIDKENLIEATIHVELPGIITVEAKYRITAPKASAAAEEKAAELAEALRNPPPKPVYAWPTTKAQMNTLSAKPRQKKPTAKKKTR